MNETGVLLPIEKRSRTTKTTFLSRDDFFFATIIMAVRLYTRVCDINVRNCWRFFVITRETHVHPFACSARVPYAVRRALRGVWVTYMTNSNRKSLIYLDVGRTKHASVTETKKQLYYETGFQKNRFGLYILSQVRTGYDCTRRPRGAGIREHVLIRSSRRELVSYIIIIIIIYSRYESDDKLSRFGKTVLSRRWPITFSLV